MSLGETFAPVASDVSASRTARARPAPFSIRLSATERAQLEEEAKGAPLGAYIKAKALEGPPLRIRRSGLAVEDQTALAKVLALLGRSHLASNLNQLARAANSGSLPMTPETEECLRQALGDVRAIRRLLVTALGLKAEARQ